MTSPQTARTADEIAFIDPELLKHATPAELALYEADLIRQKALLSPLDYAIHTSDGRIRPFPHTELLSQTAKALVEHALYDDGPGIPAVWTPNPQDEDDGRWLNPETGEEAHNIAVISAPPQHGKAAKDYERVLTTAGFKNHGDLVPGDEVFHPSGQPVRVLATQRDDGKAMRVEFFDGTHVDVHPNHEWTLYNRNLRREVTVETHELAGEYARALWSLPHRAALQTPEADLPIDPYTLGAWLGDGCSTAATICGSEDDLNAIVARIPYELGYLSVHKDTGVHYRGFRDRLITKIKTTGLFNNKHIPEEYLLASEAQRRELLAGLVDTDGHWSEPGKQIVFVTASLRLAEDVRQLVRTLGYRSGLVERVDTRSRTIKSTGTCYAVTWSSHDGEGGGHLPRKKPGKSLRRRIGVKAVYEIPDTPGQCIQVDSPDGLYLVGEALIPTHNSLILSETTPAWYLTRYPHNQVIVTGYEADFAKGFGRRNRDKIEEHPELGIKVSKSSRAADQWTIEGHDGGLITAGAGGGITGKRADFILIDDPVKNSEEALSESARRKNKEWWQSTIKSRQRTNTVILIIQTRWHEDDLAGHVSATERCYTLNLPALAFEETDPDGSGIAYDAEDDTLDPLGRKPGEPLCPALQTRSMLLKKQESGDGGDEPGGMLWFSALYQGKPNIEGGGILPKPYRYYTVDHTYQGRKFYRCPERATSRVHKEFADECIYFVTSDLATTTKTTSDYTVFSLFAWTQNNLLLLIDLERVRIESSEHIEAAEAFWRRAKMQTGRTGVRFFGVEDRTFGTSLVQNLNRHSKIPVRPMKADTDKIARAVPVGIAIRQDQFFLPERADFLYELEREMQVFPNGKHDDQVDTLGYAVKMTDTLPHHNVSRNPSHPEQVERDNRRTGRGRGAARGRNLHPVLGRLR